MQQLLLMAAAAIAASSNEGTVLLENKTIDGSYLQGTGSGPSQAGYRVNRDGAVATLVSPASGSSYIDDADEWIFPRFSTVGDAYQVRFTKTGGTAPLANDGVWQALTSDRVAGVSTVSTQTTLTFTVEIRKGTGSVLDSCTVSLTAEVQSI